MKNRIAYKCNKKGCKNCSYPTCSMTMRLEYAKNWNHEPNEKELEKYFDALGYNLYQEKEAFNE